MNEITVKPSGRAENIQHFLDLQDVCDTSLNTYRRAINRFYNWIDGRGLAVQHVAFPHIKEYKKGMIEQGLSSYTISLYITVVRKFFQCVEDKTPNYRSPARGIKGAKINSRVFCRDSLTKKQIKDLFKAIDGNKRDRAMILLMVHCGLRTIEVSRCDIGDIRNQGNKEVLYIQGKGRTEKDDFVVLNGTVLTALRAYLKTRKGKKPEQPLFVNQMKNGGIHRLRPASVSWVVKSYLREIGIDDPRISAHSLRHSCATVAYDSGIPVEGIQGLMRHSAITTTMKYVHMRKKTENNYEQQIMEFLTA